MAKDTQKKAAPSEKFTDARVRDFYGKRKLFFIIAIALVVLSICSTFIGVNIALEFKGGTIITYAYEGEMDENTIQKEVGALIGSSVNAQLGDSLENGSKTLSLSFSSKEGLTIERQTEVSNKIEELYPDSHLEVLDANDVDASTGSEFFMKCIVAAIFAALILIIYIALRFKAISGWTAGICAVLGLLMTLVVAYGAVVLCRFEIDSNFMAVILTLLGYAVNDTIVIYDRIRENQQLYPGVPIEDLVNMSSSQSMRRTIRTSVTTIFSMCAVTGVAIAMDVTSILSFSVPIIFGLIMGTFNSLCFVPTFWTWWQKKRGIDSLKAVKKKKAV